MEPVTIAALISGGASLLSGLLGGGDSAVTQTTQQETTQQTTVSLESATAVVVMSPAAEPSLSLGSAQDVEAESSQEATPTTEMTDAASLGLSSSDWLSGLFDTATVDYDSVDSDSDSSSIFEEPILWLILAGAALLLLWPKGGK